MKAPSNLVEVSVFIDDTSSDRCLWFVWVQRCDDEDYRCWVRTPEGMVLTGDEQYSSEVLAMADGRLFVELSLEPDDCEQPLLQEYWRGDF